MLCLINCYSYIYTEHSRSTYLGERELLACGTALHHKGVVVGVGNILAPQTQNKWFETEVEVSIEDGKEILVYGVCLVPPSLTLPYYINAKDNRWHKSEG